MSAYDKRIDPFQPLTRDEAEWEARWLASDIGLPGLPIEFMAKNDNPVRQQAKHDT